MNIPDYIFPKYEEVIVGESVKFRCLVQKTKQTPKYVVSWIFNDDEGNFYGKLRGRLNENFVISKASLIHNGFYTCTGHTKDMYGFGFDFIATAELRVFGKPM